MSMETRLKAQLAADELDRWEAMDLVHHLKIRFGWSVTIFTEEDVWVRKNGQIYTVGEAEDEVTEEMREAIRNDRGFTKWLDESLSETGSRQLPTLVIDDDGSWSIEDY